MNRIAIVEDDKECARLLVDYIERYKKESQEKFLISIFTNGMNFLDDYKAKYDMVFMDIEMPHLSGMETARKLREFDENICIVFVTNMAQYATSGYEVCAMDFMVKPVRYFNFTIKLKRAICYRAKMKKAEMVIKTENGFKRIPHSDIYYIEVSDHILTYHTLNGKISERGTIKKREEQLREYDFVRCNSCYLVNAMHVTEISVQCLTVGGVELSVSRTRKKEVMNVLTKFNGEYIK